MKSIRVPRGFGVFFANRTGNRLAASVLHGIVFSRLFGIERTLSPNVACAWRRSKRKWSEIVWSSFMVLIDRIESVESPFVGSGDLRLLCRTLDWSATGLGKVAGWPSSLRTVVRMCLDAATVPMAIWAGQKLTLIYNQGYADVLGAPTHPGALGRPAREVWSESWSQLGPQLRRVMEHGECVQFEGALLPLSRSAGDDRRLVSYSFVPVRNERGDVVAALQVVHTAQKRVEEALRAREAAARQQLAELEALYETAPIGLCLFDEHLRWVRVNRVIADINGRSIEEHLGRTPSEVVPDVGPQAEAALRTILRTGERLDFEMHGTTSAQPGIERAWSEHWAPIKDPTGRIIGISVAAEEITDRKRTAKALAESEERFRTLAENIPQLAWMADETGSIFWYNRRWYEFTGTTLEEMRGWGWQKVHHPDHVARVVRKISHCFATGETWEDTFPLRARTGEYHWFLSRATPIRDAAGNIARWLGTNTDVTEQQAAEEAVREADRHKTDFLAWLSHELRNPIGVIHTCLALIDRAGVASEQGRRALPVIQRQVTQVDRLLQDLLDIARISKGKILLRRESVELNEIVRTAGDDHRQMFEHEGIGFDVAVASEPLRGWVDRARIAQAVGNLLQNAAKFTPRGGQVVLSLAAAEDNTAMIEVRDNGAGLAPEMLDRVFEPLVQDVRTIHRTRGGLGLGLALVRQLAELHGGTVIASNGAPGGGAVFTVRLPL